MSSDPPDHPLRVLLVGIDPVTARTLRSGLVADGDMAIVGEEADGDRALRSIAADAPDIVLVDVDAPDIDAVALTRRVEKPSDVVLIGAFEDEELALAGLLAGASGFLVKDLPDDDLRRALRGVRHGEAAVSRRLTSVLIECLRAPQDGGTR